MAERTSIPAILGDGKLITARELVERTGLTDKAVVNRLHRLWEGELFLGRRSRFMRFSSRSRVGWVGRNVRAYHLYLLGPRNVESLRVQGLRFIKYGEKYLDRRGSGESKAEVMRGFLIVDTGPLQDKEKFKEKFLERTTNQEAEATLGRFEKYIYFWIALCGVAGLLLDKFLPQFVRDFNALNVSGVSIPIAVLMFFLMYPTMAKVKLEELSQAVKNVGPTLTTLIANWIIAPPLMVLLATLFLRNPDFQAGIILLGISPCTGMVLFWIALARGNVTQGVVITAINAVSTLLLYAPVASFYLGIGGVPVPFSLVSLSVLLFVGLPLIIGQFSKRLLTSRKGEHWFSVRFLPVMNTIATVALLGMLVPLFSSEGRMILEYPLTVALIAVPILLHFVLMLTGTHLVSWLLHYRYEDAAMASLIGSSTQFEVAIGTATVVFGLGSGAALATVVGPLMEVPVMVTATKLLKRTQPYFLRKNNERC